MEGVVFSVSRNVDARCKQRLESSRDVNWNIRWPMNNKEPVVEVSKDQPYWKSLDRVVGVLSLLPSIPFHEKLCSAAFKQYDDKMCVPRQIAEIVKLDYADVCDDLHTTSQAL